MIRSGAPAVLPRRPAHRRSAEALRFAGIALRLALVLGVAYAYRIEEVHVFPHAVPLLFGGFLVHAALPMRWRRPFFLALGLAALGLLLGVYAVPVAGAGLGLVGLCHLPLPLRARAGLVGGAWAGLTAFVALGRAGAIPVPMPALVWLVPVVLATLFLFRLALYLHALAYDPGARRADGWTRLGYFFLPPNPFMPLFPVVDFGVFRRSFYRAPALDVYARGVAWTARGIAHLLAYRVIYYGLLPDADAVTGPLEVAGWMALTFALYLRVSGLFHLAAGLLCLFGYDLPPTHRRFALATSLPDFFRRLNVYWHDALHKTVFAPALARLRRPGAMPGVGAITAATTLAFAVTVALFAWQAFWLDAGWRPGGPDVVFWGTMALLTTLGLLRQRRATPRARRPASWRAAWRAGAANVLVLTAVVVLWSIWAMPSLDAWHAVVARAAEGSAREWIGLAGGLAGLAGLSGAARWIDVRVGRSARAAARGIRPYAVAVAAAGLLALPHLPLGTGAEGALWALREDRFHQRAAEALPRGYADELLDGRHSTELWRAHGRQPLAWNAGITATPAGERVGGLLGYALVPNVSTVFKRAPLRTNAWGMRDDAYALEKPPGTYRIALLGSSYEMGWAVRHEDTFEARLERRLNAEHGQRGRYDRYEVLNFAVTGYGVIQMMARLDSLVTRFAPDVVVVPFHESRFNRLFEPLPQAIHRGEPIDEPFLQDLARRAGLQPGQTPAEVRRRLAPFRDETARWAYGRIAETSRAHGIVPVWLFLPGTRTYPRDLSASVDRLVPELRALGFVTMRADRPFAPHAPARFRRAPWDDHPGPDAHARMAERIFDLLRAHDGALGLDLGDGRVR